MPTARIWNTVLKPAIAKYLGLGEDTRLNVIDKSKKINADIKVLQKI
jgi:hypothetical protein